MKFTAKQIADLLQGTVEGDPQASVQTFAKIEEGVEGAISFLANPHYEHYIYDTKSSVVLVNQDFAPSQPVSATLIRVPNAYEAIARLLAFYESQIAKRSGIHPTACIDPSATVGENCYIGPFVYIGEGATVGNGSQIYAHTVIEKNAKVGSDCLFYPNVSVYHDCEIGNRVTLHSGCVIGADGFGFAPAADGYEKIPQIGKVIIEDNVEIGANSCVDRSTMGATRIHRGVKLDNLIQIGHNVQIGENTVSSAQTGIAGTSKVGSNCFLAGQVGIADHVTIGNGVKVGSKSGIDKDVPDGEIRFGYPALPGMQYHRASAVFKRLPELDKRVIALEKALTELNNNK